MNILIVHDREEMRRDIQALLNDAAKPDWKIDLAADYVTARRSLVGQLYDLVILDLTLPHISGKGTATYQVVENLVNEILMSDDIHIPGDIIGITRETEAFSLLSENVGQHLMAVVSEDTAGKWKQYLIDRLHYVVRSRRSRFNSIFAHFDYDFCLITALDKELAPFFEKFDLIENPQIPGTYTFHFEDSQGTHRKAAACSIGRAGQASAASKVQSMISQYRPSLCVMSGFCGGVEKKTNFGDVCLFEVVIDWDYGKWKAAEGAPKGAPSVFFARPEPISIRDTQAHAIARKLATEGLSDRARRLEAAKALSPDLDATGDIKLVVAASGSAVVGHNSIISQIKNINDNVSAIDMESYGTYFASKYTSAKTPEFLCVKSVADYCDGDKDDLYHAGCCYLSACVVEDIILRRWEF